jgi:tetratricopeptide (TPR) repeat protein
MDSLFNLNPNTPNIFQNASQNSNQFVDIGGLPIEELLSLAESNYLELNYEKAGHFYEEAIKKYPDDIKLLTSYGNFLFSTKEINLTEKVLEKAIAIDPLYSYKNYLMLGEISSGLKSIDYYKRGIELMWTLLNNYNDPKRSKDNDLMDENEENKEEGNKFFY